MNGYSQSYDTNPTALLPSLQLLSTYSFINLNLSDILSFFMPYYTRWLELYGNHAQFV